MSPSRDFRGYGPNPPQPDWPNESKIAIQCVLNYEEGGERCLLHGDGESEAFLSEIVGAQPFVGRRHMNMESLYEYGSRVGFWRLYRLLTSYDIPVTVFGVAMALAKNPDAVGAMKQADWEIASHGWRWLDYALIDPETEAEHLQQAIRVHTDAVGEPPEGWYIGRTSEHTRSLLLQLGSWSYDSDSYSDDLPYWLRREDATPHLVIPYTLDVNDMRFATVQGFNTGEMFFTYLKDSFDALYAEGEHSPKMMSIGLHNRIVGRPGRIRALARFFDYVKGKPHVWFARRIDIANHWHNHHFPSADQLAMLPGVS